MQAFQQGGDASRLRLRLYQLDAMPYKRMASSYASSEAALSPARRAYSSALPAVPVLAAAQKWYASSAR